MLNINILNDHTPFNLIIRISAPNLRNIIRLIVQKPNIKG